MVGGGGVVESDYALGIFFSKFCLMALCPNTERGFKLVIVVYFEYDETIFVWKI